MSDKPSAPPGSDFPGEAPPPYQPMYQPINYQQGAPQQMPQQMPQPMQAYPGYGAPPPNMQMPVNQPGVPVQVLITSQPASYTQGRQTTVIVGASKFGPNPQAFTCPSCQKSILTRTYSQAGLLTWILSGTLCLLGCVFGCCLLPFCVTECKDIEHRCPNCKNVVGYYRRI